MADKSVIEFAKNLELASKSLQMYSETHPRTQRVLEEMYKSTLKLLESQNSITLSVFQGNLLVNAEVVAKGDLVLTRLSRELNERNVDTLKIVRGVKQEDLFCLLRNLILSPQRIRDMGGFEQILLDSGIDAIQVNKVKYGIIDEDAQGLGLDPSMLSDLLSAIQSIVVGTGNSTLVAENVEKSLETNQTEDPGATLLKLFQMISPRTTDPFESSGPTPPNEKLFELYRSFSPGMQSSVLLTSILQEPSDKNGFSFHQQLPREDFEISILRLLDQPLPKSQLAEVARRLQENSQITLPESVMQKLREKDLLLVSKAAGSFAEEILKKEVWSAGEIEKIPEALAELINDGKLQEADQLSKKLFSYVGNGQPEQKSAAIKMLPGAIRTLSKNDRWKNVEFSLSFLISTFYRKENSPEVLRFYIPLFVAMFMKNYEAKNWQACQDVLSTIRIQTERFIAVKQEFADAWVKISEAFIEHLREGWSGAEVVVNGFHIAGNAGLSYLIELLVDEEDQKVRSRLIGFITSFRQDVIYTELRNRMSDPRWFVVRNMVTIAGKIPMIELPEFLEMAAVHPDPRVGKELIKILYKGTAKSQLRLILLLMEHPDRNVRIQAVHLVTMQANAGAIPAVLQLLETTAPADADLRTACWQALLKLRSSEGIIPAATLLDRKPSSKIEIAERNAAVRLLGEVAREQARSILERTAQTDPNPETRALAASYL